MCFLAGTSWADVQTLSIEVGLGGCDAGMGGKAGMWSAQPGWALKSMGRLCTCKVLKHSHDSLVTSSYACECQDVTGGGIWDIYQAQLAG